MTHLVGGHISCKPDEVHSFFNNEILPSKTIESGNQYKINVCFTGQNYIQDKLFKPAYIHVEGFFPIALIQD